MRLAQVSFKNANAATLKYLTNFPGNSQPGKLLFLVCKHLLLWMEHCCQWTYLSTTTDIARILQTIFPMDYGSRKKALIAWWAFWTGTANTFCIFRITGALRLMCFNYTRSDLSS